jgi:uncharacterized protein (DUF2336 family)
MAGLDALALSDELTALARAKGARDPEGVVRKLCLLAERIGGWGNPAVESVLGDVLVGVVASLPPDAKTELGERLAAADWAPPELIGLYAQEDIALARPLIARSSRLDEAARLTLLREGSLEHRLEVARGPGLTPAVADAIVDAAEPVLLTSLAENPAASLNEAQLMKLVNASSQVASLRAPLARHPTLTPEAGRVLQTWADEPLRAALIRRFAAGDAAAAQADRLESEAMLIAKLRTADQLRPSYLLRALREGRLSLFAAALAELAGCDLVQLRRQVERADPETLALACAAVGIDRSVFPTLLGLVRDLAKVGTAAAPAPPTALALPPDAAATALRERLAKV